MLRVDRCVVHLWIWSHDLKAENCSLFALRLQQRNCFSNWLYSNWNFSSETLLNYYNTMPRSVCIYLAHVIIWVKEIVIVLCQPFFKRSCMLAGWGRSSGWHARKCTGHDLEMFTTFLWLIIRTLKHVLVGQKTNGREYSLLSTIWGPGPLTQMSGWETGRSGVIRRSPNDFHSSVQRRDSDRLDVYVIHWGKPSWAVSRSAGAAFRSDPVSDSDG